MRVNAPSVPATLCPRPEACNPWGKVRLPSAPLGAGRADTPGGYFSRQYFDCAARTAALAARERAVAPGGGPSGPGAPEDVEEAEDAEENNGAVGRESASTSTVDSRQALSALSS